MCIPWTDRLKIYIVLLSLSFGWIVSLVIIIMSGGSKEVNIQIAFPLLTLSLMIFILCRCYKNGPFFPHQITSQHNQDCCRHAFVSFRRKIEGVKESEEKKKSHAKKQNRKKSSAVPSSEDKGMAIRLCERGYNLQRFKAKKEAEQVISDLIQACTLFLFSHFFRQQRMIAVDDNGNCRE